MRDRFENGCVSTVQIESWRRLVVAIRKQVSAVSSYLSMPELALLLRTTLQGTVSIFVGITNGWGRTFVQVSKVDFSVLCELHF